MDDLTQRCSEGSVELQFVFFLVAARFVEVVVDEAFHGVEIQKMLSNFVVGVAQCSNAQWLVEVT